MRENENAIKCIKIGLLGDTFAGKSAICRSVLNLEFNPDTLVSIGADKFESKFIVKNGENVKLLLLDVSGVERFRAVALKALDSVRGIIIVFDITRKSTFDNLNIWLNEIRETYYNPRLVLFGNKVDMSDNYREVSTEEAKKYAESQNLPYFEISAKTRQGMNEGLSYIVNEIYDNFDEIKTGVRITKPMDGKSGCVGKTKHKGIKNKKGK